MRRKVSPSSNVEYSHCLVSRARSILTDLNDVTTAASAEVENLKAALKTAQLEAVEQRLAAKKAAAELASSDHQPVLAY